MQMVVWCNTKYMTELQENNFPCFQKAPSINLDMNSCIIPTTEFTSLNFMCSFGLHISEFMWLELTTVHLKQPLHSGIKLLVIVVQIKI